MESFSIAGVVRGGASATPNRPALTFQDASWTWMELHERSCQVAQAMAAEGVGRGDRVAFLDKNGPAYLEGLFGGAMLGAVNVAVNWRLAPTELAAVLDDAGAKLLVIGAELLDQLAAVESRLTTVTAVVVVGGDGDPEHLDYETWLGRHEPIDPAGASAPDDLAMLVYTSGTTGQPKGVMLTNANLGAMMAATPDLGFGHESVAMVTLPLFHVAGSCWLLLALASGARIVLHRDVDPTAILDSIERDRITHTLLVPVILFFLLHTPGMDQRDFSSLELIVYGTSPVTEDLLSACLATFGCGMAQVYGMTETAGPAVVLSAEDHTDPAHPERLRAAGRPWPGVELQVVDGNGADVPTGEVGEVLLRTPQVTPGYWQRPAETAEAFASDGWLRTGDAGYLDADGYLFLVDRVKDMIVSGGENVYPIEVENILTEHPAVAQVAVIGIPSDRWGETVHAVVVPEAGAAPSADDLISYCKERLAGYRCPTGVDFVDDLPRNMTGKVLKRELREPYWAGRGRCVN